MENDEKKLAGFAAENSGNKCDTCAADESECASCAQNSACGARNSAENAGADEKTHEENEPDDDTKGLDYLTKLCYAVIDRASVSYGEKRNLLMAVYSFRCLFDTKELHRVSKALVKYGCSFVSRDPGVKAFDHVYEITDGEKTYYKFDVGSPAWKEKYRRGEITGENAALPDKPTLYEAVARIISLDSATDELRALWLVYFPYVFLIGAPVEYDLLGEIEAKINNPGVYKAALDGKYADNICCTTAELSGEHPLVAEWYRPFIEWKSERNENGISRETAKYQRALMLGEYEYVMHGTEKLLDSFPDDEEITLLNITARSSLVAMAGLEKRVKLLSDNFRIINEAMKNAPKKYNYLLYYRGLTRLGMNDPESAKEDFEASLKLDPRFEPSMLILKGMENAETLAADKSKLS